MKRIHADSLGPRDYSTYDPWDVALGDTDWSETKAGRSGYGENQARYRSNPHGEQARLIHAEEVDLNDISSLKRPVPEIQKITTEEKMERWREELGREWDRKFAHIYERRTEPVFNRHGEIVGWRESQ